jgi:hypothetical protein
MGTIPEISEQEMARKPYIVAEKFKETIRGIVDEWMGAFPRSKFSYHEAIQCFEGMVDRLQTERHIARKKRYEQDRDKTSE